MMNAPLPDLRGEHRTEPVPPKPHCFVADIDTTLEQEIFYLSQGQRKTDVHHHHEADHFGRAVEITEGIVHLRRLRNAPPRLKPICSDNAVETAERIFHPSRLRADPTRFKPIWSDTAAGAAPAISAVEDDARRRSGEGLYIAFMLHGVSENRCPASETVGDRWYYVALMLHGISPYVENRRPANLLS